MPILQFWFEFASTYSYLAAMRIERAAGSAGVLLEWKPFLLGPIFQRQGWNDSPYNLNPVRGRYMWRDVERYCLKYGLPFRKPSRFPRNGLLAARVACSAEGEPWIGDFTRAVFRANFGEDREISSREVIEEILRRLGRDGGERIARAESPENKERLRAQTESAWQLGIFGAPSFLANGELFWGNDRLEEALAWTGQAQSGE